MKIDTIVTAVNANPVYLTFAPYMCVAWRELTDISPIVAYINSGNPDIDYLSMEYLKNHCTVVQFEKLDIENGIQAKITRMWMASRLRNSNIMIADVDMIPMTEKFVRSYDGAPDDHLVKFGTDHFSFQSEPDIGKWPMHGTAANGSTFKEIVNPKNLDYKELIESWNGFEEDPRSNTKNIFMNFSDESLLKTLADIWNQPERCTEIKRTEVDGDYNSEPVYGRLCRSKYNKVEDVQDLSKYYECHGPRPYHKNLDWYEKLR